MVVDSRNFYYSNGADLLDLMNLMSACGACDALNLDGGGSSTFIARDGAGGRTQTAELADRPGAGHAQVWRPDWRLLKQQKAGTDENDIFNTCS